MWFHSRQWCCAETSSSTDSGQNPTTQTTQAHYNIFSYLLMLLVDLIMKGRQKTCHCVSLLLSIMVTYLSPDDINTDAFSEDDLHVGWVAQLNHCTDCQVDPLVSWCHTTQLGALMDRRVPGSLHFHLDHIGKHWKINGLIIPSTPVYWSSTYSLISDLQ